MSNDDLAVIQLTDGQKVIWAMYDAARKVGAYNMTYAWECIGLDTRRLFAAIEHLYKENLLWRAKIQFIDGEPSFCIKQNLDISAQIITAVFDESTFAKIIYTPINLEEEFPVRWYILKKPSSFIVIFQAHHIISDVWSTMHAINRLKFNYTHNKSQDSRPKNTILDFINHQNTYFSSKKYSQDLNFWKTNLSDDLPILNLPTDRSRASVINYSGGNFVFNLEKTFHQRLDAFSKTHQVTPFAIFLSAYQVFLNRYTGQKDLILGVPTAGRDSSFGSIFGYFVNTIAIRSSLKDITFSEYISQNYTHILRCLDAALVPLQHISTKISIERDMSRPSLFQAQFIYENSNRFENRDSPMVTLDNDGNELWDLGELKFKRIQLRLTVDPYELSLKIVKAGSDFYGILEYREDLFNESTIERMVNHFSYFINELLLSPNKPILSTEMYSPRMKNRILEATCDKTNLRKYPDLLLHDRFFQLALESPQQPAVQFENTLLTYATIAGLAAKTAKDLCIYGCQQETIVAIYLKRRPKLLYSIISTLLAGGAYVTIDPSYPEERVNYILEDSKPKIIITEPELEGLLPKHNAKVVILKDEEWIGTSDHTTQQAPNPLKLSTENVAYLIYTSGSTGKPKGVAISHHSASTLVSWSREVFSDKELSLVLFSTSTNFDLSIFEMFSTLSSNGCLILVENALSLITQKQLSPILINTVPSVIHELVSTNSVPDSVKTINLAGEVLNLNLIQSIYQNTKVSRVLNLYGPSEDTTYSTYAELSPTDSWVPIGKPIPNTSAFILDSFSNILPIGVPGELYLGGHSLARCYLAKPKLTAERFIPDFFSGSFGARIYKTGDLIKINNNGLFEYLGRLDHQVKLRGFRIELGEIEAQLTNIKGILKSLVVVSTINNTDKFLVAYLVTEQSNMLTADDCTLYLAQHLPEFMIPSYFIFLEAFPLTSNGKIDRKALPPVKPSAENIYREPRNEIENILSKLWQEILNHEQIGIDQDFFRLGGHSLMVTRLRARIKSSFGVDIELSHLFSCRTIEKMAALIEPLLFIKNSDSESEDLEFGEI